MCKRAQRFLHSVAPAGTPSDTSTSAETVVVDHLIENRTNKQVMTPRMESGRLLSTLDDSMTMLITSSIAKKLIAIVNEHKSSVSVPPLGNWKAKGDSELWSSVLVQISVAGSASSGMAVQQAVRARGDWYRSLVTSTPRRRLREIHQLLRSAGVRWASAELNKCKKTRAAANNVAVLASYDGPKAYFKGIANIPQESWRIAAVADDLTYLKHKGARDLLIGLGLIERAIAFDTRLAGILERCGARLPDDLGSNKSKYKALESELITKVCEPCGVTGGHFDRILFNRFKTIVV
ncbi:MAG: hypothetical protein ACREVE_05495 [Gammaproteobacteria bacterium]